MSSSRLKPDQNRIWCDIETLSSFRDPDREGWTRRSFTTRYRQLACFTPMGMIFVPSRNGRSLCPEEYTDPCLIALGTEALLNTVLEIDKRTPVSDAVK